MHCPANDSDVCGLQGHVPWKMENKTKIRLDTPHLKAHATLELKIVKLQKSTYMKRATRSRSCSSVANVCILHYRLSGGISSKNWLVYKPLVKMIPRDSADSATVLSFKHFSKYKTKKILLPNAHKNDAEHFFHGTIFKSTKNWNHPKNGSRDRLSLAS